MLKNTRPIGVKPGRVTDILAESTELPPGQVRFEKAKQPRRRRWGWEWARAGGRTKPMHVKTEVEEWFTPEPYP